MDNENHYLSHLRCQYIFKKYSKETNKLRLKKITVVFFIDLLCEFSDPDSEDLWSEMRALLCKTPPPGPRCWGHGVSLKATVPFCLIEPSTRAQSPWAPVVRGSAEWRGSPKNSSLLPPSAALNQKPVASVATTTLQGIKSHWLLFRFLVP